MDLMYLQDSFFTVICNILTQHWNVDLLFIWPLFSSRGCLLLNPCYLVHMCLRQSVRISIALMSFFVSIPVFMIILPHRNATPNLPSRILSAWLLPCFLRVLFNSRMGNRLLFSGGYAAILVWRIVEWSRDGPASLRLLHVQCLHFRRWARTVSNSSTQSLSPRALAGPWRH